MLCGPNCLTRREHASGPRDSERGAPLERYVGCAELSTAVPVWSGSVNVVIRNIKIVGYAVDDSWGSSALWGPGVSPSEADEDFGL
jgi:hypothetical protein